MHGLTEEQQRRRDGKMGASFIPALMAADPVRIYNEWARLVDHPDYEPEDLSHTWPVIMGTIIETPALDWYEWRHSCLLTRRGEWVLHPERDYLGCTLDAWRDADRTVIDCKWTGRFRNLDEVRAYYTGQLIVQKACTLADRSALLIVQGGDEPTEYEATWDETYEREVWDRIYWFWQRVETLQPPVALPAVKAPVPAIREVDMSSSNVWAAAAGDWLRTKEAAAMFEASKKQMKDLIEPDVKRAYGHGVIASRSKAGAIGFKAG